MQNYISMESTALKKTMSLRISSALYEHLKKVSSKENRSVNNYVETILFKVSNFQEDEKTYSDETGDKIIRALEEYRKGETTKITPETLWEI
jgi:hypothetical protein